MSAGRENARSGAGHAGPGTTGHPERLARALDEALAGMVAGLEAVADCPSATVDLPDGLTPKERLGRFCDAIIEMGRPLLAGLASAFAAAAEGSPFLLRRHVALWQERSGALIGYLEQLARVHGVAFAGIAAGPTSETVEQALRSLRARLEDEAADALAHVLD